MRYFEDYLDKQYLRFTGQRQVIVNAFFNHNGHISSEELYRKVQETAPDIDFTTVYRTLKLLSDAELALNKNFGDGYT